MVQHSHLLKYVSSSVSKQANNCNNSSWVCAKSGCIKCRNMSLCCDILVILGWYYSAVTYITLCSFAFSCWPSIDLPHLWWHYLVDFLKPVQGHLDLHLYQCERSLASTSFLVTVYNTKNSMQICQHLFSNDFVV